MSFEALAGDLQAVWSAPTTDARLKKRIVRTLIHETIADIDDAAAEIVLTIHWVGGAHTEHRVPRRRRGQRNNTLASVVEAVRTLALIAKDDVIAGLLNRNGLNQGARLTDRLHGCVLPGRVARIRPASETGRLHKTQGR